MWLRKKKKTLHKASYPSLQDVPRYPPYAEGLPVIDVGLILESQEALITQLRTPLAQTEAQFAERSRPMIERYAAFVHLLPASEAHHHRGTGGLFRHGLEVAFNAVLRTEDMLFAMDLEPVDRRQIEPIWKYAVFLTGLFHDVGKPVGDLSVTDRDGQVEWDPMEESLMNWARSNQLERYFLHWRRGRHKHHEELSMYVAPNLFGKDTRSYLRRGGATILQAVATALAGNDDGIIYSLVHQADESSTARDLKTNPGVVSAGGGASLGVPVERHLQDAMRRLLAAGKWTVNQPGSKVWVLDDGVYVVWVGAVEDIGRLLSKDKIPGIPKDKDILADILVERGLAVAQQTPKGPRKYWRIAPMPLQREGRKPIELTMLRLADPSLVFDGSPPPTVERCAVPANDRPRSEGRENPGAPHSNQAETNQAGTACLPPGADHIDPETGEVLGGPWGASATDTDDQQSPLPLSIPPGEQEPSLPDADAWMYQTQEQWRDDGKSSHPPAASTEAPASTNTAEEIQREQAYLRQHGQGQGGAWLATVAEWIADRRLLEGTDYLIDPRPTLAWPELAMRLGEEPKPLITALSAAGWLVANPDNAMRRVIEVRGLRGIQLEPAIAEHFRKAIGYQEDAAATGNKPAADTTMTGKPSPVAVGAELTTNETQAPDRSGRPMASDLVDAFVQSVRSEQGRAEIPGGVTQAQGMLCVNYAATQWYAAKNNINRKEFLQVLQADGRIRFVGKSKIWLPGG